MAHAIIWSERALERIDALAGYIARDSEERAREVVRGIFGVGYKLQRFPFSGRVVPELGVPTIREFLVYNYRVIYRTGASQSTVLTVIQVRQRFSAEEVW